MKRWLIITAAVLILCTGCSKEPPKPNEVFTVGFSAEQEGMIYGGTLSRDDSGVHIVMQEPYTVRGLCFDYSDGQLEIGCGAHSTRADTSFVGEDAVPTVLYQTLLYLPQAEYRSAEGGEALFALPSPYGEATLTTANGTPVSLSVPQKAEVRFYPTE